MRRTRRARKHAVADSTRCSSKRSGGTKGVRRTVAVSRGPRLRRAAPCVRPNAGESKEAGWRVGVVRRRPVATRHAVRRGRWCTLHALCEQGALPLTSANRRRRQVRASAALDEPPHLRTILITQAKRFASSGRLRRQFCATARVPTGPLPARAKLQALDTAHACRSGSTYGRCGGR